MNLATDVMLGIRERLGDFEKQVKQYATEPYGQKKLTEREQYEMYRTLTPDKLIDLMREKGYKETNEWLYRMEQLEAKYGR